MDSLGTEVGQKMRSAIKAKLMELGCYVDDELPDYIMVMVANKRSRTQMEDDLQLFLRSDTEIFVEWLQQVLKKLKEVTITNPDICGSFKELKRKAALEIAECVIKKEKKDKKGKLDKKTRTIELVPEIKSITDEIPVQAIKLVEKRNQNFRTLENTELRGETSKDFNKSTKIQIINEDNFNIPSLDEVNELEDSQLDIMESKIKEARNRIVLMKSDSEDDEDFINIKADAEELMGNELDKSNLSNSHPELATTNKQRIVTMSKENNNLKVQSTSMKLSLSERLGARPNNNPVEETQRKSTKISLAETLRQEQELSGRIRSNITKPAENKTRKKESVHKRLGLPSSVVSLPKKEESESVELPKSVMSVVQVKPRRNIPAVCQANKNLLLKAVAEAQKSVTQTPIVGNKNKEALFTKKYREQQQQKKEKVINTKSETEDSSKLENIIIEVKHSKTVPVVEEDSNQSTSEDECIPSAIDLTFEDDLEDINTNHSPKFIEKNSNEKADTNLQFIVTLDGLKDTKLLKHNEESPRPAKRQPSPIVFETEKPKIPEKLPKVNLPISVKTKERCKYWPNCRLKEACEYVHPSTPCNMFPICKFGDKCLYIHPKCKFDASCTRKDCPYSHGIVKPVSRLVPVYPTSPEVCKYHPNCSNPHCLFYHPRPCRFGKYCLNKTECSFSHGKIPNKEKLTWHSNVR